MMFDPSLGLNMKGGIKREGGLIFQPSGTWEIIREGGIFKEWGINTMSTVCVVSTLRWEGTVDSQGMVLQISTLFCSAFLSFLWTESTIGLPQF